MIIDASSVMAMLRLEPDWPKFATAISAADLRLMSAGTWIELGAITARRGEGDLKRRLDALMHELAIDITPVTLTQAQIGHNGYWIYGQGRHRANLNFGDCFAYALAKETGLPLLFKGDDFIHTDIVSAL